MIFGFNYGAGGVVFTSGYNASRVASELTDIRRFCMHLRVAFPSYNANPTHIVNAQNICLAAKAMGFYVVWGITANGNTLTSSTYPAFKAAADSRAAWCATNGIDEFSYGNEEELRTDNVTLSYSQLRVNLRTDGGAAKAANPGLKLAYSVDASSYQGYINEGIGTLDYISINNYGYNDDQSTFDLRTFQAKATAVINAFGAQGYISEYNIYSTWSRVTMGYSEMVRQIAKRKAILQAAGASRIYFYTYSNPASGDFALKLESGDYHPMFPVVVGERPWFSDVPNVIIGRAGTPIRGTTPARSTTPQRG
jgi:hypothetical protein